MPLAPDVFLASSEFRANTTTAGAQIDPSVCRGADGRFAVAWGSSGHVFLQRYTADGSRSGGETQISSASGATLPDVACNDTADLTIVWTGNDASGTGIRARSLNATGGFTTGEVGVNTATNGSQRDAAACLAGDGSLVVVWDDQGSRIVARRRTSIAAGFGAEITVASGALAAPAVSCSADGRFTVVWADTTAGEIHGRFYAANGAPTSNVVTLGSAPQRRSSQPTTAPLDAAGAFVAWEATPQISGTTTTVLGQRHVAGGSTPGANLGFRGSRPEVALTGAAAASFPGGDAVLAWEDRATDLCVGRFCCDPFDFGCALPQGQRNCELSSEPFTECRNGLCCAPQPTTPPGVFLARFDAAGLRIGPEIPAHADNDFTRTSPDAGIDADGDFIVVWESADQDGDGGGIYGRRFGTFTPERGVLSPCGGREERWTFAVAEDQEVQIAVDSLATATTADFCFTLDCGDGAMLADDVAACTHPLPAYACPQLSWIADGDRTCSLAVTVCSAACANVDRAEYQLLVDADGATPALQNTGTVDRGQPPGPPKPPRPYPAERLDLPLTAHRSLDGKVYVVVPSLPGKQIQINSIAIGNDDPLLRFEEFDPDRPSIDYVLTAFAAFPSNSAGAPVDVERIQRTDVIAGLDASPTLAPPTFDACANSGAGVLRFPSGAAVSTSTVPQSRALYPLTIATADVPAVAITGIRRELAGELRGQLTGFPNPPATCVDGPDQGLPCTRDSDCRDIGLQPASCAQVSYRSSCAGPGSSPCDPAQSSGCMCNFPGGEAPGQTITLEDTLDSPLGAPDQLGMRDGFRLDGRCDDPSRCQALVLVVDAPEVATELRIAVAGFVVDDDELVRGTAGGQTAVAATPLACSAPGAFVLDDGPGLQGRPAACIAADGTIVAVWSDAGDVAAQLLPPGAADAGAPFRVPAAPAGSQTAPSVCCVPNGFVVAWEGDDASGRGVYARRFSVGGAPLGGDIDVNAGTAGEEREPSIACGADGSFRVAWARRSGSISPGFNSPEDSRIRVRSFAANGAPTTGDVDLVADNLVKGFPGICTDDAGVSTVYWSTAPAFPGFFPQLFVEGRMVGTNGAALGGLDLVTSDRATLTRGTVGPAVACAPAGEAIVAWHAVEIDANPRPMSSGIFGKFLLDGGSLGFTAVATAPIGPDGPAAAYRGDGSFLLAWNGVSALVTGLTGPATFLGGGADPAVACGADAACVAIWESGDDIFARRLPADFFP